MTAIFVFVQDLRLIRGGPVRTIVEEIFVIITALSELSCTGLIATLYGFVPLGDSFNLLFRYMLISIDLYKN